MASRDFTMADVQLSYGVSMSALDEVVAVLAGLELAPVWGPSITGPGDHVQVAQGCAGRGFLGAGPSFAAEARQSPPACNPPLVFSAGGGLLTPDLCRPCLIAMVVTGHVLV